MRKKLVLIGELWSFLNDLLEDFFFSKKYAQDVFGLSFFEMPKKAWIQ